MKHGRSNGFYSVQVWIYLGAALFLVALLASAILVPDLRILHSFQALIYIAVIVLARRNSPWGYGAGFAVAIVWNGIGLFVTHLIQAGAVAFWSSLRTGHVQQLVRMTVTLGGIGHFILIFATILAVLRCNAETPEVVDVRGRRRFLHSVLRSACRLFWDPLRAHVTQSPSCFYGVAISANRSRAAFHQEP